jgi:hypothetical protein
MSASLLTLLGGLKDGNGDPRPVNPQVKTLLGCGYR